LGRGPHAHHQLCQWSDAMNSPDPVPPAVIPWYKSTILRGILIAFATQLIDKIQIRYHMNLSLFGLNAQDVADWAMDAISAGAMAWAVKGRVVGPVPPVALNKAAAQAANSCSSTTPDSPAQPPKV
jgi:hypothetical protein